MIAPPDVQADARAAVDLLVLAASNGENLKLAKRFAAAAGASGLRAAREYLASRSGESGEPDAQPYPLLLVRPSGVMAYYAARESLQSWGSDFGYQFIDEDWTLTFPPADPALAEVEERAIAEARRRLELLSDRLLANPVIENWSLELQQS